MTYTQITLVKADGLATLTLSQPEKLNAVSRKMIAEIKSAWEDIAADGSVRAVLLTGAGRGFCAGADLADPDRDNGPMADSGSALEKYFNPVIRTMRTLPKPIVAAVNGVAAGVGMSFALAADIAVAEASRPRSCRRSPASRPAALDGGSHLASCRQPGGRRPRPRADHAGAADQGRAGQANGSLIWDVVEDAELMKTATGLARRLADGPTLSLARIKEALNKASGNDLGAQLDRRAPTSQRELGKSEDFQGGRSGLPRQAQGELQREMTGETTMTTPRATEITSGLKFPEARSPCPTTR